MRAHFRFALYSFVGMVALTACGQKPGYQKGTDLCSGELISDYNDLKRAQRTVLLSKDYASLQNKANAVKAKYKDVSCRAENLASHTERTVSINSEIDSVLLSIDAAKKLAEADAQQQSRRCTQAFVDDLKALAEHGAKLNQIVSEATPSSDLLVEDQNQRKLEQAVITRDAYVVWQSKYQGVKCEVGTTVFDVVALAKEFQTNVGNLIPAPCPTPLLSQMSALGDAINDNAFKKAVILVKKISVDYPTTVCVGKYKNFRTRQEKPSIVNVPEMAPKMIQLLEDASKNGEKSDVIRPFGTALMGDCPLLPLRWAELSTI